MRDIRASEEVWALVGAEKLRELHGDALVAVRQDGPHGRAHVGDRARSPAFHAVRLAHAGCADSQIIKVGAARVSAVADDLTHRHHASRPRNRAAVSLRGRHPARGVPGMKTTRLARRLDLDGNPLRRHTGKIAAPAGADWEAGNHE